MYIKEIRLNGFKSFADKVNIELGKTFTGIVGPNGSGKSNILDAIKWVLGEGSIKNLRTDQMSDVIFNGSKNRNASNSAQVSIVFDNSDKLLPTEYNEVEIKRIVYKTGENEYFLNKEKCRLKDITDLLTDSFSSKESLNIIPQGKIDEILLSKPEERRTIIEEAASVLKYKKRKEATLKKLSNTHENIDRVNMIISELEERVNPLKIEAEKAKEFKEYKEKIASYEISLLAKDITFYNSSLENRKKEKELLEEKLSDIMKDSSKDNSDIEKSKLDLLKIDDNISIVQNKLNEKNNSLSSLKTRKELIKERSKYEIDDDKIQNNLIVVKEKEASLKSYLNKINLDIKALNKDLNEKEEKLNVLNSSFNKINEKKNKIVLEINNYKRKEYEFKNRIDILDKSIKDLDKVPYSVKSILNNNILKGIIDIIGNVIETTEEYNIMLSVALSSCFNFVIVENEENAKDAINYLKSKSLGRVTFFPLNIIKPKMVDPETLSKVKNTPGFISLASDLVNYDKKFYNIVMNQLGNIIVAKNADSMVKISKLIKHKYRVISLTGEIMNTGGSITGGSLKINNITSDKYEIIKLEKELESIEKTINNSESSLNEFNKEEDKIRNEIYSINIELVKIKELLKEKDIDKKQTEEEYNLVSEEVKTLSSDSKSSLDEEFNKLLEEYEKEEKEKQELLSKLETLTKEKKNLNDDIFDKENIIKNLNSSYNETVKKINEIEIENTKNSVYLDNLLTYLNEEYSMTYEKASSKYEPLSNEEEARSIVNELKKKIKNIGNVNLNAIEEYERISKRYDFLISQKNDLSQSENDLLNIISDMDEVMKKEFKISFDSINSEFSKVFKELFKGGDAYLTLTNPDNLLETGIDIVAVPSGKKIKSLSQLSGGEKTLTAVSLLFAIMNLKNVPFAILDEIESALDEANVERFGSYINKYKGKTQLLIITHKKKTMEYVDMLYGITMQESGVSKLVSVKLEELK